MTQTRDGYLWIGTFDGLVRYDGVKFTIFDRGNTPVLPANLVLRIELEADGGLWIDTGGGPVRYRNGTFTRTTDRISGQGPPGPDEIREAGRHPDGAFWRFSRVRLIRQAGSAATTFDGPTTFNSSFIRTVFIDREGVIWVGTNANGLFRLTRRFLTAYGEEEGLVDANVYPLLQDRRGVIWAGANDGLARFETVIRSFRLGFAVRSLYEDRAGRLWAGGPSLIARIDDGRIVERIENVAAGFVDVMVEDGDGAMWLGTPRSLVRLKDGRSRTFGTADGLPDPGVNALLVDRQQRLWVGTRNGIARLEGERFIAITERDGLAAGRVRTLHEDREGVLWVGTFESGLSRIRDGRISTINTHAGLFNNGVFQIVEDAEGNFWISCNRGIYRVKRSDLNAYADGRIARLASVAYGTQDGMRTAECNGGRQPAGFQAQDGRIWFPTQQGIVAIEPGAVPRNAAPPLATIEEVAIDGKHVAAGAAIALAPGQTDLEITYTAPSSIKAEHVTFRYALEGLSGDWIDAGTRRSVHYSHLPPGHYTFKVVAANSDGVWSDVPALVGVRVRPHFYQTGWFYGALAAGLIVLAGAGYAVRVRRLVASENRLKALVAERTAALEAANARLEELAAADSLTGIANRRRFSEALAREWQRAQRSAAPLSLLLIDVDHFKLFNDTRGHAAGDDCLRAVADLLAGSVSRSTDIVARFGGEEFAVLLADTDLAGARLVAELIRDTIAGAGITHGASPVSPHVTVSVGVAADIPQMGHEPQQLIERADQALYQAKRDGRNRVCVSSATLI